MSSLQPIGIWLKRVFVGPRGASFINIVTMIAKRVPLTLFILIAIVAFHWDKFTFKLWVRGEQATLGSITHQIKSTMLVTLWMFIGIEGASVYLAGAANRKDVERATVIGFLGGGLCHRRCRSGSSRYAR